MLPTLRQKLTSYLAPQNLQSIQMLIKQLCAAVHASVRNLVQPLLPITRGIDSRASAGNAPAAIQPLEPIHPPPQIFADRLITTRQLAQRAQSIFSVVDRSQHSGTQQLGQLARIHLVTLAALFQ